MRLLSPLLANLLLVISAFGVGSVLRPLLPPDLPRSQRAAATTLGGLGLLGTLLFLVGLVRFSRLMIITVLIAGALVGVWQIAVETRYFSRTKNLPSVPVLAAAVIALVLLLTFVGGLAEPVGDIKLDAISYHFLGPRVWLRDAVIHPLPDEAHASFPAVVETLFAALLSVGGIRAPELFAFLALGLLLLIAFGWASRMGLDARGAWWAVALIATMPVVYRGSYGGFNDAILAGFCLLALRFALDAHGWKQYTLAGVFAGLAMGTKYTGIIAFLITLGCALLLLSFAEKQRLRSRWPGLLFFAASAVIIAAPWYLRNWLVLGSPIYPPPPALLRVFTVKFMSSEAIQALATLVRKEGDGMGRGLANFLLLPFHLTYHPANFLNGAGGVGVALLALAPFGLWMFRRELFARVLMVFIFLQTLAWFVTEQEARFLIPLYVLLAIFAVAGSRYVSANAPRFGPLLAALAVACSVLYGGFMIASSRVDDLHAALSPTFETRRISREVPFLDTFAYLNSEPSVSKVLVLAPRFPTFYLQKSYLKPVGRYGEESLPDARDTNKLLAQAASLGITHVVDVRVDDKDFQLQDPPQNLTLVLSREDQRIYRLLTP